MIEPLGEAVPLLDHGYIRLIEKWGSDERIIEAARMSTDKGFLGWKEDDLYVCSVCKYSCAASLIPKKRLSEPLACPNDDGSGDHALAGPLTFAPAKPGDERLLRYLWTHKHATPFEMSGMIIEVQAPLFVFREWHRHRTQSYNEMSGRYIELPKLCYVPSDERISFARQAKSNKQSSEQFDHSLDLVQATVRSSFKNVYETAWTAYEEMLELGVARELAVRVLPTAQYSRMRASANLRNWLAFLTLRMDPAAQWEIRMYANEVARLVSIYFPRTYELFAEGQSK